MASAGPTNFEGVMPVLRVSDMKASLDYYVRALGFEVDWGDGGSVAGLSRGRCSIILVQGDQGHFGSWMWIGVEDCEALFAEYQASGAKIRHPPTNYFWALEMQVEDLDGNVLRLGSEPKKGEPFGEWMDMDGVRWLETDDGWKRLN